ncbi:type IV pilus biogenesis/stability protein PilW [Noviherbaspirillum aridicola]|uniref:Type IV pilus biogenesis/stability protein PilW n=1 Tax=Noviherbaspirillum aridicola TaxID=2849687 RepID=A0ABQ4Q5W6_9BURK|nr:type IV pilus biogenesis/stability protein PilW [Noviherbaspirillum aridicola]GIZ52605.1 type IV pilus biogenesis/stability protein PilW [Noviherbaspirillum aridicola]
MRLAVRPRLLAATLLAALLAAGCGAPGERAGDLPTASDQTDSQRRAQLRLQLAISYYEQRQMATALDEIKQALTAYPNFAEAHSMRGLIYMDMGENRLAEESFQQALRLSPASPDFNNNYGWFLCQNGRERESLSYFETALKSRAYQSPAKALNNAGTCSLRLKETKAAEQYFTRAFQADPGNPTTNFNLAKIHYNQGDYERAKFYVGRVMKAEVMSADVLWLAIRIERKRGDRTAEQSLVTQLRRRHGSSAEFAAYQRGAFDE